MVVASHYPLLPARLATMLATSFLLIVGCKSGKVTAAHTSAAACSPDNVAGTCPDGTHCVDGACVPKGCAGDDCTPTPGLCENGTQDAGEGGVDCGGDCLPCPVGSTCASGGDCSSQVCAAGVCAASTCDDSKHNGDEADDDCGGPSCPPCGSSSGCTLPSDCQSNVCEPQSGRCLAPSCTDGVKNGDETGADCGGACPVPCAVGSACLTVGDCSSGACTSGLCRTETCADGTQDGDETGVDCGGPSCAPCETPGAGCNSAVDCTSRVCLYESCREPTCFDGVRNGDESDVDCGGSCAALCSLGGLCITEADCADGACTENICRAVTCANGSQDAGESGVDCGGACPPCVAGGGCTAGQDCASGICRSDGTCEVPTCTDGIRNGDETGVDCGAVACDTPCADYQACSTGWDCNSGVCNATTHVCAAPSCSDRVRNGDENGIDCGGSCAPCGSGAECTTPTDCQSGVCSADGACVAPTCVDGVRNGDETGADCGGSCAIGDTPSLCADGSPCLTNGDCVANQCLGNICAADHCQSGVRDGTETDTDCGGPVCPPCSEASTCQSGNDCVTLSCGDDGMCAAATCDDGVHNGDETAVDCGGNCSDCTVGAACIDGSDCDSTVCVTGRCQTPSCSDGAKNASETDVDCGADCPPCAVGDTCTATSDCNEGLCVAGMCQAPSCVPPDGLHNGNETDLDCGGQGCPGCGDGGTCLYDADCQSGICSGGTCQVPSCDPPDGVVNGDETDTDCGGDACPVCPEGALCEAATDCLSGFCSTDGRCAPADCTDGMPNGDETDVDCGGSCNACTAGQTCKVATDCLSLLCTDGTGVLDNTACTAGALCCQASSCDDGVRNGTETDVDCGGADGACGRCAAGEVCALASDCASGVCSDGRGPTDSVMCQEGGLCCQPPVCGDGVQNADEACDDGDVDDCSAGGCLGDCSAAVAITGCGDGVACGGEACDDGNAVNTDDCKNDCTAPYCGDLVVSSDVSANPEECDDGNGDNEDNCRNDCTRASCGDGLWSQRATGDLAEACDDGNDIETDNCRNNCARPECGDGLYSSEATGEYAEECDDHNNASGDGCTADCKDEYCGDGIDNDGASEACDDGSDTDTDNCRNDCTRPLCGDGFPSLSATEQWAEACDDGYECEDGSTPCTFATASVDCSGILGETCAPRNDDECRDDCTRPTCGDGVAASRLPASSPFYEACDDGNRVDTDNCTSTCDKPRCGDGIVSTGATVCEGSGVCPEVCDDGAANGSGDGACLADCSGRQGCGNGTIEGNEACDDGKYCDDGTTPCTNVTQCASIGDGTCAPRTSGEGSCLADCSAVQTCGDGIAHGTELCDGTDMAGRTCADEGFTGGGVLQCNATCNDVVLAACQEGCGNGRLEGDEACDGSALAGKTCTTVTTAACDTAPCFTSGTLSCNDTCTAFDTSQCAGGCGDNAIDSTETCDGIDLAGKDCTTVSTGTCTGPGCFAYGDLACAADCSAYDVSGCTGGCGNGTIDAGEVCDGDAIGIETCATQDGAGSEGTLSCNASCDSYDLSLCIRCGDGAIEGSEVCDVGALDGETCASQTGDGTSDGALACNDTCSGFDASGCSVCGDDIIDGAEICDGSDLGGTTCTSLKGPTWGGILSCKADCTGFDDADCRDCGTCPGGTSCEDGTCVCPVFYTLCDGACIDLRSDPANCGACGTQCQGSDVCSSGTCTSDCQPPLIACTNATCLGQCVDPTSHDDCCGSGKCEDCTDAKPVCVAGACASAALDMTSSLTDPTPSFCLDGGDPILINEGSGDDVVPDPLNCGGDLAAVTFRWAFCTCTDAAPNQGILTDAFDSAAGPYTPLCEDGQTACTVDINSMQAAGDTCAGLDLNGDGLLSCTGDIGGGFGANGTISAAQACQVWGSLWWGTSGTSLAHVTVQTNLTAPESFGSPVLVGNDITVQGALSSSGTVSGDAHVGGAISNTTVEGDLYIPDSANVDPSATINGTTHSGSVVPTVANPCDCTVPQRINVASIVDAHRCTQNPCLETDNNNNYDVGLLPDLFSGGGGKLRLPCGHYYFTELNAGNENITLVITGRTAIYVDGHVDGHDISFSLTGSGELDLFVKGGVCGQGLLFGSPNYPARARMYVGGGDKDNEGLIGDRKEDVDTDGDGNADDGRSNTTCSNVPGDAVAATHGLDAAGNIYAPWGTLGAPQDVLVYGSLFLGSYSVSQSTAIHFDKGVVSSSDACPTDCGNGEIDNVEVCDGQSLGGATCVTQGFDGGTLHCADDCSAYDTSDCFVCGDDVVGGNEQCEPSLGVGAETCENLGFDGGTLGCRLDCSLNTSGCYYCGNNTLEDTEQCDTDRLGGATCLTLGHDGGTLGCNPRGDAEQCTYDLSGCFDCGDDVIDPGEQCDTDQLNNLTCVDVGYTAGTLGCKPDCTYDTSGCRICGDFVIQAPEQCDGTSLGGMICADVDPVFNHGFLVCNDDCGFDTSNCASCGNGVLEGVEVCDPGPELQLGGSTCASLGFAGDRPDTSGLGCTADCTFDTTNCQPVASCGDGIRDAQEECDGADFGATPVTCEDKGFHGGTITACNPGCTVDVSQCTYCGDGVAQGSEQCDGSDLNDEMCATQGYESGTLACGADCAFDTSGCADCGNGVLETGEACDGSELNGETCASQGRSGGVLRCYSEAHAERCTFDLSGCFDCGNGIVESEAGEDCEPSVPIGLSCANIGQGSGTLSCNANCTYNTSACVACGDGFIEGGEQCDGADLGGETCTSQGRDGGTLACYSPGDANACTFDTSGCFTCGNDLVEDGEQCDNANVPGTCVDYGFDGGELRCLGNCAADTSRCYRCGDGVINAEEVCDSGALAGESCKTVTTGTCGVPPCFSGGTLACYPDGHAEECKLDTSECYQCGDGAVHGIEECDGTNLSGETCVSLGYAGDKPATAGLQCAGDCTFDTSNCEALASCDGVERNDGEQCDGNDFDTPTAPAITCTDLGYDGGTVTQCRADCTVDTSGCYRCGDGVINGAEVCDGDNLNGETCESQGLIVGTLGCGPDCTAFDTSGCGECRGCRDCGNQACINGVCTSCTSSDQCCAPLLCVFGTCTLF